MFVVVGANGKTGSAAIEALKEAGKPVRGIVRRPEQADALRSRGVEAAVADAGDRRAIRSAFAGAEAVYVMSPPAYSHVDMFARAHAVHATLIEAAEWTGAARVVALSSVGAQHSSGTGNILTTYDLEQQLAACSRPVTVLRAANFIDNWGWGMRPVMEKGILPSMLLPVERKLPMQSSVDIGRAAAALMMDGGDRFRLVELHGPADYSPSDAADALTELLGRPVEAVAVPETDWAGTFRRVGMPEASAAAFCEMYRGFNSGLIAFEGTHETRRGSMTLKEALGRMVGSATKEHEAAQ